jgi:hypothetical protein
VTRALILRLKAAISATLSGREFAPPHPATLTQLARLQEPIIHPEISHRALRRSEQLFNRATSQQQEPYAPAARESCAQMEDRRSLKLAAKGAALPPISKLTVPLYEVA